MLLFGPPDISKLKSKSDVKGLIKALKNTKDKSIPRDAIVALGDLRDARAIEPLLSLLLKDTEDIFKYRIITALDKIGDPAFKALLTELKSNDKFRRKNAAFVLGWIGDSRAVEALITYLEFSDERAETVVALRKIGGAKVVEPLISVLDDKNEYIRKKSANALGLLGDKRAIEPLNALLDDEDINVRLEAAIGLCKIGDKSSVWPLIFALEDNHEKIRSAAAEALGIIGDKLALMPLISLIGDNKMFYRGGYRTVQDCVAEALGKIGTPAIKPLTESLNINDEDVRMGAILALRKIGSPAFDVLIGALKHSYNGVRQQAAYALGEIGDSRAIEPLEVACVDKDKGVRRIAKDALKEIRE